MRVRKSDMRLSFWLSRVENIPKKGETCGTDRGPSRNTDRATVKN